MNLPLDGETSSRISSLCHTLASEDLCNHMFLHESPFCHSPPVTAAERAVRRRARASSAREGGSGLNREQDGVTAGGHGTLRGRWVSILNREQRLQQIGDVAVTLSGVCLCAFWTTLLYHLL